jgi:hypothetical protein
LFTLSFKHLPDFQVFSSLMTQLWKYVYSTEIGPVLVHSTAGDYDLGVWLK